MVLIRSPKRQNFICQTRSSTRVIAELKENSTSLGPFEIRQNPLNELNRKFNEIIITMGNDGPKVFFLPSSFFSARFSEEKSCFAATIMRTNIKRELIIWRRRNANLILWFLYASQWKRMKPCGLDRNGKMSPQFSSPKSLRVVWAFAKRLPPRSPPPNKWRQWWHVSHVLNNTNWCKISWIRLPHW